VVSPCESRGERLGQEREYGSREPFESESSGEASQSSRVAGPTREGGRERRES
jgi:hypothetical protein